MQTMFDRLGDLLSEALETGKIPSAENKDNQDNPYNKLRQEELNQDNPFNNLSQKNLNQDNPYNKLSQEDINQGNPYNKLSQEDLSHENQFNSVNQERKNTSAFESKNPKSSKKKYSKVEWSHLFSKESRARTERNYTVIKFIPENIKKELSFIGIPENAGFEEAKKIYREKLMYYHPDRRADNPVLQKVAKEKTARLLESWEILEKWYGQKN